MFLLVDRTREHEQSDLVDARHRLESRFAEVCSRRRKVSALQMRLRERRIVVTPKAQIAERIVLAQEIDQVLVDHIIFLAATHPVGKCLLRDQTTEEVVLFALAAREPLDLVLVTEDGIAEDIRAVAAVVLRLLMPRCFARARCPHNRAEHIERDLRMGLLQPLEPRCPFEHLCTREGMLARTDETAVDHGIRRDDSRLYPRLCEVLLHPCPQLIGMPPVLTIAEQLLRRDDNVIADVLHDICRLLA